MKLRAPEGCASICHDGQIFVVESDGSIEVKKEIAVALAAHGFTPWDEAARAALSQAQRQEQEPDQDVDVDIDALNRAGLFAFLREHGVRASRRNTNVELRALAREALNAPRGDEDN